MSRNKVIIAAAVVAGVFLAGFLPQYIRAHSLSRQLEQARSAQQFSHARDLLGSVFLQTSLKNYGLAKEYASSFFEEARALSNQPASAELKQALQQILQSRDEVTARLARGDPASYGLVQSLYQSLLQASNPPAINASVPSN